MLSILVGVILPVVSGKGGQDGSRQLSGPSVLHSLNSWDQGCGQYPPLEWKPVEGKRSCLAAHLEPFPTWSRNHYSNLCRVDEKAERRKKLASRHSAERAQNRQETARRLLHCISSGQHTTAAHYHQAGSTCLCPTTVLQLHNRYPQQLHGKIRPWLLSTWHLVQQSDSSVLCEGLLHSDTKENHSDRFPGSGMLKALRHTSWLCIKGAWRYLNAHAFISTLLVK